MWLTKGRDSKKGYGFLISRNNVRYTHTHTSLILDEVVSVVHIHVVAAEDRDQGRNEKPVTILKI